LLAKLWGSKVAEVPFGAISGLPGEKSHLDVTSMPTTEYSIRGKVVASPKFGPW